ncbi:sporulation histidine kinase inhibitor Sda [Sporosarcina obsidiansis]|uniref:sporulation histidine kinase inhibitor Sda n=1 Tax=Sporosarcina obsidiansis TaxID=2660748 RepID=UPI00129AC18A|nr:sporulation histidine kinase inhibitor Sda [Sporosarcina obsidiansis]
MKHLSDEQLITSYLKAYELNLDDEFLGLLKKEIDYRLFQSHVRQVVEVIFLSAAVTVVGQRYQ